MLIRMATGAAPAFSDEAPAATGGSNHGPRGGPCRTERDALRAELASLRFDKVRRVVRDLIRRSRPAFRH